MAFSSTEELKSYRENTDFPAHFVVRFEKDGRQSDLAADDIDHALTLSGEWIKNGANYVEVFRLLDDGTLNPTIGAHGALAQ